MNMAIVVALVLQGPRMTVSPIGDRVALDVNVVAQPAGGAAVAQGLSNDGGYAWHVQCDNPVDVVGTFWQSTQPVSGTFWQATQPVSLASVPTHAVTGPLTDTELRATAVPVSLASAPTTPVTGTFWQATQPVSGPVTDAQLRATPVPVVEGSSTRWSCFVQAVTATTQCRAAPAGGIRAYVTSVACSNLAATVQGVDVVFGTGSNCATGTTALTHKFQLGTNATTTSPFLVAQQFPTPLVPTAANAVCLRPTAATSFGCTLTGYDAP